MENNIKKPFLSAVLVSFAAVMYAACGDDSSSSAAPGDTEISSGEESDDSSSSVIPDSDRGSSGSAKSSDSNGAKSSSSVAESSSSYKPYDHKRPLLTDSILTGAYKQFTDDRNGRSYYYLTINGKDTSGNAAHVTVMAENLNIGERIRGRKDQANDTIVEKYCYDNKEENCDQYGALYQWAEMMALPSECNTKSCADQIKPNHQGICPTGWRLLTYNDFYIAVHADGNDAGVKGVRAMGFGGHNYSGYSLVGAGTRSKNMTFKALSEAAYWSYPEERADDTNNYAKAAYQSPSTTADNSKTSFVSKT